MSKVVWGYLSGTYVVPWNDLCNNANRLAQCVGEFLVCSANSLAEDLVCPAAVVAECVDGLGQVLSECHGVWFACGTSSAPQNEDTVPKCIPLSQASTEANTSLLASIRSASFDIRIPLSVPGNSFQDGLFKAALAALTAVSTSFAEPACTSAMVASVLEMLSAVYHASFSSMKVLRRINGCNGLATSSRHHLAIDE